MDASNPHHKHIHRHGLHTHVHVHGASGQQSVFGVAPGLLMISLFGIMMSGQAFLVWWRRAHYQSYQNTTLVLLWLIPLGMSVYNYYVRFVCVHMLFSAANCYYLSKAMRRPLSREAPRSIYTWFFRLHRLCNVVGLIAYIMFIMGVFFNAQVSGVSVGPIGFLMGCYSLYFGIMSRDLAEMCTNRIASQMGVGNLKSGELPMRQPRANMCAICGEALLASTRATASQNERAKEERVMVLDCKHQFHESCVRGWTIVGKKDTCPYCNEKVRLRGGILTNPWEKQTVAWGQVLDAVRYLIVWNPIILVVVQVVLNVLPHTHHIITQTVPPPLPTQ